ncbi:MAG: outer membrane lipoprotein carrier protein LolA [Sutterella sp.]|nr:outer membrane lipoprotein carrier protein LolA [Sutterella sp.]
MRKSLNVLIFLSGAFFLASGASATDVLRAEFTQTKTLAGFERALTSSGTVVIYSDLGLIWQQLTPFESNIKISKEKMTSRTGHGTPEVVSLSDRTDSYSIPQLVQAVFSGNDNVLATCFNVEKESISGGKVRYTITPKTKEGFPLFLSATVIKATDVERVDMIDAAKNKTTILFTNTRYKRLTQSDANREFQDQ